MPLFLDSGVPTLPFVSLEGKNPVILTVQSTATCNACTLHSDGGSPKPYDFPRLLAGASCVSQVCSAAREFKTPDAQQIPSRSADAQCFLLVVLGMEVGMDQTNTNPSYSGVNRRAVLTHSHYASTGSLS